MYRDMLTNYSGEANAFISQQDPALVTRDDGVLPIIETILRGGGSSSGAQGAAPPPPPPMAPPGAILSVRLNSEIGPRDKGPPAALAGAMMKDKKPFTYTPGGIDLSEIRSPRMAKRLQMNAAAEGVTSAPKPAGGAQQGTTPSPSAGPLPPAAMAAMQPQMAFCVFPQGAAQTLNRTPKPLDYTDGTGEVSVRQGISNGNKSGPPPPPPPPPMMAKIPSNNTSSGPASSPAAMQMQLHAELLARVPTQQPPTPPTNMVTCPQFPAPPVKAKTPPPQNYPFEEEIRVRPVTNNNVGQGSIYIQPISPPPPVQQQQQQISRNQPQQQQHYRQAAQNKAQNLGSIYIPPIEQQVSSPTYSTPSPSTAPSSAGSMPRTPPQPQPQPPPSMQTPQLKKTPTPWMNSYNKMATKQAESPPYVNPANISTPWGTLGGSQPAPSSSQIGGGAGIVYTIPIAMAQKEDPQLAARGGGAASPEQSKAKAAQHLGRVIPIQIQRQESLNKEHQIQAEQERGWPTPTRTIPIQVETRSGGQTPTGGMKKGATPSTYNNPIGLYSGQNAAEAYKQQTGDLASGVNNVTIADQAEREPVQSKSMRVIQKVAENDLRRLSSMDERQQRQGIGGFGGFGGWQQQDEYDFDPWKMDLFQNEQNMFSLFNPQVDDGSFLHNTAEPRFLGGHIPSKAFKTLQTTLPSESAGSSSTAPPARTTNKVQLGGPVMHNIPIQMSSTSPTPPSDRVPSPVPPSEQRALSPKKYMGSNIPSRSFKMLQAMTGPDQDADAPDASSSSSDTNIANSSGCGGGGGGGLSSSPCPSIYLSWHYWWYYVTCYWAGYDMTGYDYPEGWDPENPYFPPELAGTLAPDGSSYFDVPQIVVEGNDEFCDSNEQQLPESTEKYVENMQQCDDETEDDSCYDDVKLCNKSDNYGWMSEDGDRCNTPIVEEPSSSTVSTLCNSEDSDAATIVDEVMSPSSMSMLIEEYFSSSESEAAVRPPGGKHVLSTIEELTDESRGSTPRSGRLQQQPEMEFEEEVGQEIEGEEEEEEESPSEDEASSVSVIENKSASQSQQSVSKREDETSSSSSSEEEEEEEEEEEDGDDENEPVAVTVRLPLKLCFGKTKSYKDITTVLVGDVDVGRQEEEGDEAEGDEEGVEEEKVTEQEEKVKDEEYEWRDDDEGDEDDEPVVSFTISLSRQTSRDEEKVHPEVEEKVDDTEIDEKMGDTEVEEEQEQEEDVDFWSKIIGPSTSSKKEVKKQDVTVVDDYRGSFGTSGEPVEEESQEQFQAVDDFWGTAETDQDDEQEYTNNEAKIEPPESVEEVVDPPATTITINLGKSTSSSKIGTSWDTEFNFWDKSLRTIETRRFSGNFEISEDYESDSGMKSDSGQRHRRHRVKKFKKHSVPVGLPVLRGRQSSRSLKLDSRPTPFSFVWETESKNKSSPKSSPPRNSPEIGTNSARSEAEEEEEVEEEVVEKSVPTPATDDDTQQGDDLSVGWSFWDSIIDRNNTTTTTTGNDADDFSPDVDVQISLPLPVDREETDPEQGEEEEEEEEEEQAGNTVEEEINAEIEEEKVLVPERKLSDGTEENSEDSSKSSGTTVKGVTARNEHDANSDESFKSSVAAVAEVEIEEDEDPDEEQQEEKDLSEAVASPEDETPPDFKDQTQPVTKSDEIRPLEIQEISESMKLSKDHQGNNCTCHIDSQLSRAESLLWRIERFLHESLSLGSEDDSGVMTDLSRPISDVDTDPDEQNSNDLLLTTNNTAATAISSSSSVVVTRRQTSSSSRSLREQAASNRANPNNAPSPRRPRPQSLIMLESSTSRAEFQDTVTKPRSRSAERKRYQRAKTHSRLFQLLQDESSFRDEDDATDDEFFDCEQQFVSSKTPLSFLHNEDNEAKSSHEEEIDATTTTATTQLQLHVDTSTRRSRLPPLPLKSILLNSNSTEMATTSNSSPSGSSGVLSPTSPQTRDRLLADIINEFHLRQKSDSATTTTSRRVSFSQPGTKRFSKFPSKIFKLLQEEFGEEFYQTFELGEIGGKLSPGELLSQSHFSLMSAVGTTSTCQAHCNNGSDPVVACSSSSCSLVKSDSGKSTSDFLEVPLPAPLLRRRDFRSPKSPFNKN
ncbi:uncharacterized protein LOC110845309 [Folsomia candida]|nr:uncharacterized protein LOC110845309 [Folsomia candida]